jgi:DNA-binding CsgD family transcriptional regulator
MTELTTVSHLYGRAPEIGVLDELLDPDLERGVALLVRGEPGVGKSALLGEAARRAAGRGRCVLVTEGIQAEAHLPFAALHQLLRPLLPGLDLLPPPQRAAVSTAFSIDDATTPQPFLVALATLGLLTDAATRCPLLLIADDAHWLDRPSADALAFVARRLGADPIVLLASIREGSPSALEQVGLPELRLGPLDAAAADALLGARAPDLPPATRARVLAEAAGNPLALIELPTALRSENLLTQTLLPEFLPLTQRLERAFAARVAELPAATRTLLLVAAIEASGIPTEVMAATALIVGREATDALDSALGACLVEVMDRRLCFRHPLVRSALHQTASPAERRAAHATWVSVLKVQPDRQVWHRASASPEPDGKVAEELDAAAARAGRRGAVAIAIAAQERAAELSVDPAQRGRRLLRAAELALDLGRTEHGVRLLRAAEALDLAAEERLHLAWLRETVDDADWSGVDKLESFVETAERMSAAGQTGLALKYLLAVAVRCWWGNPDPAIRAALVAAAERLPIADDEPMLLAVLAHADPVGQGARVLERVARLTPAADDPVRTYLVGIAAAAVWAFDLALGFINTAVDGLRAQGRLGLLARALVSQTWAAVHLAREPLAVATAEEANRLARETGQSRWAAAAQLAQATIAAERGDAVATEALAREAELVLLPTGATPLLALAQFARGRGAVAHQRYAAGIEHHRRTLDPADPAYQPFVGTWGLSDLVEAAAHTGQRNAARAYLDRLESLAATTHGPLLRAEAAYARPLVADDDRAEDLYRAALERDLLAWPCYRGRMLLWYGRWLRRQRRVADSRAPLRAARESFDALSFPALAELARQELRASGEASPQRRPAAWDQLTPQELQAVQLAAAGLSNREIGEKLYLSPRTVGSHLYRAFPKLGITTRAALRDALDGKVGASA